MEDAANFLVFAHRLAEAARGQTLRRWTSGCGAEDKSGGGAFDPVTEADREAERAMRALIEATFPDHGICGEEFSDTPARSRYSWSLDPIDGTRAFICGLPSWVTLIALLEHGAPVLGVIDVPCLDERYAGCASMASLRSPSGETRLAASGCTRLAEARLSTTDPFLFGGNEAAGFQRVLSRVRTCRYGLDGYAYARLAAGTIDLVVEAGLKPHDYNALVPVIRAAGGVVGDWRGGTDLGAGAVVAAATPELYAAAVEALNAS